MDKMPLRIGIGRAVNIINERLDNGSTCVLVFVAGGSSSGKTSKVAKVLEGAFGDEAMIISSDDYYFGIEFMRANARAGNPLNWDQPEAVDLALQKSEIKSLLAGTPIPYRKYVHATGMAACDASIQIHPKRVIIVEGLFVFDDIFDEFEGLRIFVDIGVHGRMIRRLLRDIVRTGQKPADIVCDFGEIVEPMHCLHIQEKIGKADLVIDNEYDPRIEAERAGRSQTQLKFAAPVGVIDILEKIGAEPLGEVEQIDRYVNPAGCSLADSDEILRIRTQGDNITLTYKGPKMPDADLIKRPIIEFRIDEKTNLALLRVYSGISLMITKEPRMFYSCRGTILSVDYVFKNNAPLGRFVEVRGEMDAILPLLDALGLDYREAIKKSYYEM